MGECFLEAENDLHITIPDCIKTILRLNGFDHYKLLANLKNEDIEEIERFTREVMPSIIPEDQHKEVFGIFFSNPSKFQFIPGHKRLLLELSEFFKKKLKKTALSGKHAENHSSSFVNSEDSNRSETEKKDRKNEAVILSSHLVEEREHIYRTIKNWLKLRCTNNNEWLSIKQNLKNFSIETEISHNNEVLCNIKCVCGTRVKLRKYSKNPNTSKRWVYGNIHRHLINHLNNKSFSNQSKKNVKTDQPREKPNTILKYFEKKNTAKEVQIDSLKKINISQDILIRPGTSSCTESCTPTIESELESEDESRGIPSMGSIVNWEKNEENSDELEKNCKNISFSSNASNSKWKCHKYQRFERIKRKRERIKNQPVITEYFKVVDKVLETIADNPEFEEKFMNFDSAGKFSSEKNSIQDKGQFLNKSLNRLLDLAVKNSQNSANRNRYDNTIRQFSLYLFYVGGRLLYETLHSNLKNILPSISCLNRFIKKNSRKIEEGFFDYEGLNEFLEKRQLPKIVWVSEDATRITGKIEYDCRTNKIVGFTMPLVNGLPNKEAYFANSAEHIEKYFLEAPKSNYANVIIAQALSKSAPPFCLCIYGTNNKFKSDDVRKRWDAIRTNLSNYGIKTLGFSSDGDTRMLKAMRESIMFPLVSKSSQNYQWAWFQAGYSKNNNNCVTFTQDSVHIATKLRTRFLKPENILPIGNFHATPKHLFELMNNFSKDKHLLVHSDLKPDDKMNYEAAEKISSLTIIELLQNISGSEGTAFYLRLMNFAVMPFIKKNMEIEERIYNIWYSVFCLRIWRQWILKNPNYNLGNNFITSNAYICIELNAHALINLVRMFRDNEDMEEGMFLPWLFSSQVCEQTFRSTRSMTSTFSTKVNFSMKDIIQRLDRIQAINDILNDIKDCFIFPREFKKSNTESMGPNHCLIKQFNDSEIEKTVNEALHRALEDTKQLGLNVQLNSWNSLPALHISRTGVSGEDSEKDQFNIDINDEHNMEHINYGNENSILENDEVLSNLRDNLPLCESNFESDVSKNDLKKLKSALSSETLTSLKIGDGLILKDFSDHSNKSSLGRQFIAVKIGNKSITIKKSTLCWLLETSQERVSPDRLRRFIGSTLNSSKLVETKNSLVPKKRRKNQNTPTYNETTDVSHSNGSERESETSASISFVSSDLGSNRDSDLESDGIKEIISDNSSKMFSKSSLLKIEPATSESKSKLQQKVECGNEGKHMANDFGKASLEVDEFYGIFYEERWYIGRIDQKLNENIFRIKFLQQIRRTNNFSWPKKPDIANVEKKFIFTSALTMIPSDKPSQSSHDNYQLTPRMFEDIKMKYIEMKQNLVKEELL